MAKDPRELRIVLLGSSSSNKSTVGNIILGTNSFQSTSFFAKCETAEGKVSGRRLALVNAPCWWRELRLHDTAELTKAGLVGSVLLCPPGPHVFLLVVDADLPFTAACRRTVEEHLGLFGDRVWAHVAVLLNRTEDAGQTADEELAARDGGHLQGLVNRCGGGCHVFGSDSGDARVTRLLEDVEGLVRGNGGGHFEYDASVVATLEETDRVVKEKAQARNSRVMAQRAHLRALLEDGACQSQRKIEMLLLGWVHSGKSSTANIILGTEGFETAVKTLDSSRQSGVVAGRQVAVVDTPGWWKYFPAQLTPDRARDEILRGVSLCSPAPHAVLLVIPVDTSFTADQKTVIQGNMERFGDKVWRHTMVVFTWGDWLLDLPIEQHIEREGEALCWLVERCGNRYHVLENNKEGDSVQVTELLEKIEEMVAGNSLFLFDDDNQRGEEFGDVIPGVLGAGEEADELVVRLLNQEWDSTSRVMREKILMHIDCSSMELPIYFRPGQGKDPMKKPERIQAEEEIPDSQRDIMQRESVRLKMILEREWARREVEIIGLYQYFRAHQGGLEAGVEIQHPFKRKVESWLKRSFEDHESSGYQSEHSD